MLERADIDAVLVATPDSTHEEIAVAAAQAGKAILLQKPMAMTLAQCRRIIAAAREAGVDLQVSWMHRHFEEVVRAQELRDRRTRARAARAWRCGCGHDAQFAGGALGSHEMSFCEAAGTDRFRLEIYCADTTLLLRTTRGPLAIFAPRLTGALIARWRMVPDPAVRMYRIRPRRLVIWFA